VVAGYGGSRGRRLMLDSRGFLFFMLLLLLLVFSSSFFLTYCYFSHSIGFLVLVRYFRDLHHHGKRSFLHFICPPQPSSASSSSCSFF
jgi:hypothetical protein